MKGTGHFKQEFLQQLIECTDLVGWVQQRVELKRVGSRLQGLCPFHSEKTPSFTVSPAKQFYYCFGCGAHGNIFDFLMHAEGYSFPEAVKTVAQASGIELPAAPKNDSPQEAQNGKLTDFYDQLSRACQKVLWAADQSEISDYLMKARGLSQETLKQFGVGYFPNSMHPGIQALNRSFPASLPRQALRWLDKRITFPIRDRRGRCIGFGARALGERLPKYLNSADSMLFQKGKQLYGLYETLYQLPRTGQEVPKRLLLVEGYLDVLALTQHGFGPVAASLGTAVTLEQLRMAFRYAQQLILCYDSDAAGQKAAWRAVGLALPLLTGDREIHLIELPPGEDPASLLQCGDRTIFEQYLQTMLPLSKYLFQQWLKRADLSSLEGKAQFCRQVMPQIQTIAQPEFRLQLEQRLAELVGLFDPKQLAVLAKRDLSPAPTAVSEKTPPTPSHRLSLLVALLLQVPSSAASLANIDWSTCGETGALRLVRQLIEQAQAQPMVNLAQRLEGWRGHKIHTFLSQQAARVLPESVDECHHLFNEVFKRFFSQHVELKLTALLEKARQAELSLDEKQLCQRLIELVKSST